MKWKMTYCFKAILVMQMLLLFGCNDDNSGSQFSNPGPECQLNDILLECKQGVLDGYALYSPIHSTTTYLTDICGEVVHLWESDYTPAHSVYLLGNGHVMRPGSVGNVKFDNGGSGGIIEQFDWDGNLVWEYYYSSNKYCQHHDIEPLPNGNVLLIAWEQKAPEEIAAAGGDPAVFGQFGVWSDHIIEVEPILPRGGRIVWEWHLWDHLIQDYDPRKKNYGRVKDHPERLDINFADHIREPDWTHMNSIDYNEELDQILLSVHTTCEILIIDHTTTTEEAAGHTGGRYGKGGDFLYRWGNPQIYRAGGEDKQYFFGQHDAHWIEEGLPGAGNILVFNNGFGRYEDPDYSSVDEIVPPMAIDGSYSIRPTGVYGPTAPLWSYMGPDRTDFYSKMVSGAQRLANGNTLICSGEDGTVFELTDQGEIVWKYLISTMVFRAHRVLPEFPGLTSLNP